jgi:Polyketide cyclase / dehydrase and lipid transport
MWNHTFETETDATPEQLWNVLADIATWPELDTNIERIEVIGDPGPGTRFFLKPKGGPRLSFVVGDFSPPRLYSDICHMPLAAMTTQHSLEFIPDLRATKVKVHISITGPLSWFWGRVVGTKHAAGLSAQTARVVARAKELAGPKA